MSGNVGVSGGKLTIALAAVRDPDDPTLPAAPGSVSFSVAAAPSALVAATAPPVTCDVAGVSSTSVAMIDLVFVNDTTGSMSGTVLGIADSVQSFATAIAGGVDAQFAMYTYGDAFATRAASGSEFTIGRGDFVPSDFDLDERPYVDLSTVATFTSFLAELRASSALGVGGGDSPENTIGALDYANAHARFRPGAAKVFVAIGDNPSHQAGDGDVESWAPEFQPTTGASLVSRFRGAATIHVVSENLPDDATYYNLKGLADGTGGVFLTLPYDGVVDLGALNLTTWLTSAFSGGCTTAPKGHYRLVITATVHGSGGTTKTGTLTFDITVS